MNFQLSYRPHGKGRNSPFTNQSTTDKRDIAATLPPARTRAFILGCIRVCRRFWRLQWLRCDFVVPGGNYSSVPSRWRTRRSTFVELYEERQADLNHPAPHTVVTRADVPPAMLRGSAVTLEDAFPQTTLASPLRRSTRTRISSTVLTWLSRTSGSRHRLVGLSIDRAHRFGEGNRAGSDGPTLILAPPAHHIAGAMILLRGRGDESADHGYVRGLRSPRTPGDCGRDAGWDAGLPVARAHPRRPAPRGGRGGPMRSVGDPRGARRTNQQLLASRDRGRPGRCVSHTA